MNYTDNQLKQALAKMLPEIIGERSYNYILGRKTYMVWKAPESQQRSITQGRPVLDTELLHLCWLVEKDLNPEQKLDYIEMLGRGEDEESFYFTIALASDWRWRVAALSRVKSIDIV